LIADLDGMAYVFVVSESLWLLYGYFVWSFWRLFVFVLLLLAVFCFNVGCLGHVYLVFVLCWFGCLFIC